MLWFQLINYKAGESETVSPVPTVSSFHKEWVGTTKEDMQMHETKARETQTNKAGTGKTQKDKTQKNETGVQRN